MSIYCNQSREEMGVLNGNRCIEYKCVNTIGSHHIIIIILAAETHTTIR